MRVVHCSREAAEAMTASAEPFVLISIRDPDAPAPRLVGSRPVHYAAFHDLDRELPPEVSAEARRRVVFFDVEQAEAMAEFIRHHVAEATALVVVHCEAGISRSAGAAAAIEAWHRGCTSDAFTTGVPNRLVYRLLLAALHVRSS